MEQRYGLTNTEALRAAIGAVRELAVAEDRYPILSSWMADPDVASPDEQFRLSLTFLLDGIATRLPKRSARHKSSAADRAAVAK